MTRIYVYAAAVLVTLMLAGVTFLMFRGQGDDQFADCRTSRIAAGK